MLHNFPVSEAAHLLTSSDKDAVLNSNRVYVSGEGFDLMYPHGETAILRDTKTLEIFFDCRRESLAYRFGK